MGKELEEYHVNKELKIIDTTDKEGVYKYIEYVVIASPTNYDEKNNFFNTSSLKSVIEGELLYCSEATMIFKSLIPFGYI